MVVAVIAYINLRAALPSLGPSVYIISQTAVTFPLQEEIDCLLSRFSIFYEFN
jgi:hypothetical protein